ncbi:DUF4296 domain-containing protein [Hymenobacter siberiensis]|uniref:DUF4296 domain-containing protein n=1 Tax=Hymenobacter siberiensis TaxID=2848396 RepID=UPI001C1DD8AB|nr:DUF4296 domain-containing protein [Hymenobacter siberiensis]MBU6121304.1 DUF4296 domain-containing protein [Hymenobacter siberiensis]
MKSFRRCCLGLVPLLLALPACQRPEEPPMPADLIPREHMAQMLADLHQLEAQVESSRLSPDSGRALYLAQHKSLLWKHEVTDSAFQRSYRYYGIHGKDLNEIYAGVIDTLNHRETKLNPTSKPATDQWGPPKTN